MTRRIIVLFLIPLVAGLSGLRAGAVKPCGARPVVVIAKANANIGDLVTNREWVQRIWVPLFGPIRIPNYREAAASCWAWAEPIQERFGEGEAVVLDVHFDPHGMEGITSLPPIRVMTNRGAIEIELQGTIRQFCRAEPARTGLSEEYPSENFSFEMPIGTGLKWAEVHVEPQGTPIVVSCSISSDARVLGGTLALKPNPPSELCDGKIHQGRIVAVTTDGQTDFIAFHWIIQRRIK